MEKDAFYFPHFSNARNDRKIKRLRKELGAEGYGVYFMILETLRDQQDFCYPMEDIDLLSEEFDVSEAKVRTVICNYGLFDINNEQNFFSPKLIEYLEPYFKMKNQRKNAAKARWAKHQEINMLGEISDATALQPHNDRSATAMRPHNDRNATEMQSKVKESKVKKSKETNILFDESVDMDASANVKLKEKTKAQAEDVYKAYPTKCPVSQRSTSKSSKDKDKIASLIKKREYTPEGLTNVIHAYIQECEGSKTFVKNFSTFLNNIPDIEPQPEPEPTQKPTNDEYCFAPKGIQL